MVRKYEEATAQICESKAPLECLNAQLAYLRPESSSCEPPESEPESVVHWVQGLKGALTEEFACLSPEGKKAAGGWVLGFGRHVDTYEGPVGS
eukprot:9502872-Pyramimonas_sp.AAC.1